MTFADEHALPVEQEFVKLADGRKIVVWRNAPVKPTAGRVAIVASGFLRRMRHSAMITRYLVENGFVVYRADYIDHVGLSDGEVLDFTMSAMGTTLEALHSLLLEREQVESCAIVCSSLALLPSIRLARTRGGVAGIAAIVGVIDTRYTLERVFGVDWGASPWDSYSDDVLANFENKKIRVRTFVKDWTAGGWMNNEEAVADLAAIDCPVVNFCGSSDDWVDIAQTRKLIEQDPGRPGNQVVELPFVGHELSRNLVAAETILREVTRAAADFCHPGNSVEIATPAFSAITSQVPYERRLEADALGRIA